MRAVYLTPHHQYPTTVTLTAARRVRILALAQRERFAIIEDDYDHEFCLRGGMSPSVRGATRVREQALC